MKQNVVAVGQIQVGRHALVLSELDKKQNKQRPPYSPHVEIHTIKRTINGMSPEDYANYVGWAQATGKVVDEAVESITYEGCNLDLELFSDYELLAPVLKEMDAKLATYYPYTALKISMELPLEYLYLNYDVDYDSQLGIDEAVLDKFDFLDKEHVFKTATGTQYRLSSVVEQLTKDLERYVVGKFGAYEIDEFGEVQLPEASLVEYKKIHRDVHATFLEATGFSVDLTPCHDLE